VGGPVGRARPRSSTVLRAPFPPAFLSPGFSVAAITNDIFTKEDAEFLVRNQSLPADRVIGVETGGCPHTAIRDDVSMNLSAVEEMTARHPDLDLLLIESGGDNLAATFSPDLVDAHIYHPGHDSERGPAEQFTRSVWMDVIAAPAQSSLAAAYLHKCSPLICWITSAARADATSRFGGVEVVCICTALQVQHSRSAIQHQHRFPVRPAPACSEHRARHDHGFPSCRQPAAFNSRLQGRKPR